MINEGLGVLTSLIEELQRKGFTIRGGNCFTTKNEGCKIIITIDGNDYGRREELFPEFNGFPVEYDYCGYVPFG